MSIHSADNYRGVSKSYLCQQKKKNSHLTQSENSHQKALNREPEEISLHLLVFCRCRCEVDLKYTAKEEMKGSSKGLPSDLRLFK